MKTLLRISMLVLVLALPAAVWAAKATNTFVTQSRSGPPAYKPDERGNRVPNFSGAGYGGGGVALPVVPDRVVVTPVDGDDGARIQAAIDYVASLPPDAQGMRGAVRLPRGRFEVAGQLKIRTSGIVLRGEGTGEGGTVLVATGTDRRTLIEIAGRADGKKTGAAHKVADAYVPVGAISFALAETDGLRVGSRVLVERPSTEEWINAIGMGGALTIVEKRQDYAWQPGDADLAWERTITAVDGTRITVDAPITTALERKWGGGTVTLFAWPGRITQVGVENLRCESAFNAANSKDEEHAWMAITMEAAEDVWIANVTAVHFASSAVRLGTGTRAVTVQDCASLAPVSETGGYRRHSFHTAGQLTLFQRCRTEEGIHDFTVGYFASGPNVFLDCKAERAHGFSGSIGSWASGVLFDNVHIEGGDLDLTNVEMWNQGVGWAAANSVLWNSSAARIQCRRPPTADNWAIGPAGGLSGDGSWDETSPSRHLAIRSLYLAQLAARRGTKPPSGLSGLTPADVVNRSPSATALEVAVPDLSSRLAPKTTPPGRPLSRSNGWLVMDGALLSGSGVSTAWWHSTLAPGQAADHGRALTRFAPGRVGLGLTDDLEELTNNMVDANQVVFHHHYGLWYDRRRASHVRVRRADGDVWPPFFEQPFSRSGQGEAWDGLSRYDLTRYNPWYFGRLREFAGLARQKGLVLLNEMFFQHNILEAGAHWADCPWRPANCIQETGFPEPPPYRQNDGSPTETPELGWRIFMAEYFYDVSHPVRREIFRGFIRQCLANLADQPNVIHTTSAQFSGPLPFMQFWLDVVGEWEGETGRHPLIALSATKDVQDAILADPKRAALVDVINLEYWWRLDDGREFAPPGGTKLAMRQHEDQWDGGPPSPAAVAGMVREYRERFPGKAVTSGLSRGDSWGYTAAGGSLPRLPATTDPALRTALPLMQPVGLAQSGRTWALAEADRQYFVCAADGGAVTINLAGASGRFVVHRIESRTGRVSGSAETIDAGRPVTLNAPAGAPAVFWLTR